MIGRSVAVAIVCMLGLAGTAQAQESGDAGVLMGYPASIGMLWHITDRIAIRPAVDFQASSAEYDDDSVLETESTSWALGFSVGALFYLQRDDRLRTYLVPEFSIIRTSTETEVEGLPIPVGPLPDVDVRANAYSLSGSFGAQYSLSDRFSVFGELGLRYTSYNRSEDDDFLGDLNIRTWGTRGAAGVVLYF